MPLPAWATQLHGPIGGRTAVIVVDPDLAYPSILAGLGITNPDQYDQYWLETAYQCIKLEIQSGLETNNKGKFDIHINIRGDGGRKLRWGLKHYPPGRGALTATLGKEARTRYIQWRGDARAGTVLKLDPMMPGRNAVTRVGSQIGR